MLCNQLSPTSLLLPSPTPVCLSVPPSVLSAHPSFKSLYVYLSDCWSICQYIHLPVRQKWQQKSCDYLQIVIYHIAMETLPPPPPPPLSCSQLRV